jgi:hypothetical protein
VRALGAASRRRRRAGTAGGPSGGRFSLVPRVAAVRDIRAGASALRQRLEARQDHSQELRAGRHAQPDDPARPGQLGREAGQGPT